MGVKHLWPILTPFCDRKPLFELQGKTLAVDLSCWVMDSQTVTEHVVQPKMYLRTTNLLLNNIHPVFVLEGKAPDLKQKTIERRNEFQQIKRTGTVAVRKATAKRGRTRFNHVLRECEEMLGYMGLKCVQGYGEAEAMCAYLNADGLVDGCVSQDNDCFLYGARVVYRNFNLSGASSSSGSIDMYSMERTEKAMNFDRHKMIALALLCGCDYDDGVNGVGKEAVLKLFTSIGDEDILDRIKSWKTDTKFDRIEAELANTKLCTSCGHEGHLRVHTKAGCVVCCTAKSCSSDYKEKRKIMMNEISIRKKTALLDNFPNQEIIDEYLIRKGPVPSSLQLKWQQPKLVKFLIFMEKILGWEPDYAFQKLLPLLTRWQLLNLAEISLRQSLSFMKYSPDLPVTRLLFPENIKKIRNIKSVASYEIIWYDGEGFLDGLVTLSAPKSSDEDESTKKPDFETDSPASGLLVTIEPQSLVVKCYPQLVEKFEEEKAAAIKSKKAKSRAKKKVDKIVTEETDTNVEKVKKTVTKRGRKKLVDIVTAKKIDEYAVSVTASLEESFNKMEITPKRLKCGPQIQKIKIAEGMSKLNSTLDRMFENLTPDDFASDEEPDLDMSEIIEEICSKKTNNRFLPTAIYTEDRDSAKNNVQELASEKILENLVITPDRPETEVNEYDNSFGPLEIYQHNVTDEFADIENYVPLSQRVNGLKQIIQ